MKLQRKDSEPIQIKPFKRAVKWDMTPAISAQDEDDSYLNPDTGGGQNPKLTLLLLITLAVGQMV